MTDLQPTADDFDDMLHALGRPETVNEEFRRNSFCCEVGSPTETRFKALGCWSFSRTINDGRDAVWRVNAVGLAALGDYLRENARRQP